MTKRGEITADPGLAQAKKTSAGFKSLLKHPHGQHGDSVREDMTSIYAYDTLTV
jgi:hypothetical protein